MHPIRSLFNRRIHEDGGASSVDAVERRITRIISGTSAPVGR
ncbi:MAG: hypothetical protein O9345_00325 [Burkholderiaceae bacterium]|jgi:hypothetical protein|nr:hypothetical protein [Burkholderiales bacterium]MCZ8336604.1 hypothetical protein [Burkholderiaceae bacterium]